MHCSAVEDIVNFLVIKTKDLINSKEDIPENTDEDFRLQNCDPITILNVLHAY